VSAYQRLQGGIVVPPTLPLEFGDAVAVFCILKIGGPSQFCRGAYSGIGVNVGVDFSSKPLKSLHRFSGTFR